MNQATIKKLNRDAVRRVVARSPKGVAAMRVAVSTKLSLRTAQTHLRALRAEGLVHNLQGRWYAGPGEKG